MYLLSDIPGAGDHVVALAKAMEAMEDKWGPYPYPGVAIAEIEKRSSRTAPVSSTRRSATMAA